MNIVKFYNSLVLDGRKLFTLFFITTLVLRLVFLVYSPVAISVYTDSYLWSKVAYIISNKYFSFLLSFLALAVISLFVNSAGVSVSMLRVKSILPAAMCFLLFSCSVVYFIFSSYIFLALVFSYIVFIIYSNFDTENKEYIALRVGFYASIATLVSSVFIYYIPVLFFCLYLCKNISLKCVLSFILGYFPVFIIVLTLSIYLQESHLFVESLLNVFCYKNYSLPILHFTVFEYVVFLTSLLTVVSLIFNNRLKNFGEKVLIRICLNVLTAIQIFSLLLMCLLPNSFLCCLTLLLVSFCISLPYFYISARNKKVFLWIIILNYITIIILNILSGAYDK